MKVTEHLDQATRPLISFEIIPPLRGGNVTGLMELIDDLMSFEPPFIDITSHAAQVVYEETKGGIQRRVKRKRPGTIGICALIQNKYHVDAVPHAICTGFTREETERAGPLRDTAEEMVETAFREGQMGAEAAPSQPYWRTVFCSRFSRSRFPGADSNSSISRSVGWAL